MVLEGGARRGEEGKISGKMSLQNFGGNFPQAANAAAGIYGVLEVRREVLHPPSGVLEGGASGAMAPQGRRTKKKIFSSLRFFYRGSQKVQAPE